MQNIVELRKVLPFSVKLPSAIHQCHRKHILNVVVVLAILLDQCPDYVDVDVLRPLDYQVGDVERLILELCVLHLLLRVRHLSKCVGNPFGITCLEA